MSPANDNKQEDSIISQLRQYYAMKLIDLSNSLNTLDDIAKTKH